ncbi:MAG: DNA polymerase IV [Rhodothermales bacterium]
MRRIIHIDMDAFYASVEQRDRPELRGRPVAVGGSSRRGVVAAASYEARRFGVHSAMPSARARRLCPELVFVKPRFDVYKEVSQSIRAIFRQYTDLVEPLSLDEAYLDVSKTTAEDRTATDVARCIKSDVKQATDLTASAGVSFNKFLAKMASDADKPDGLFIITAEDAPGFLARLPIEDFHGVGPSTASRMKELGIYTGADLLARRVEELVQRFGKTGRYFYRIVRGEDHRAVTPHRVRKSVGAERTYASDVSDTAVMAVRLADIAERVAERMARHGVAGRTVTLKIKFSDFTLNTRSTTLQRDVHRADELVAVAEKLLRQPEPDRPVRLLGLSVGNLRPISGEKGTRQLELALDPPTQPT